MKNSLGKSSPKITFFWGLVGLSAAFALFSFLVLDDPIQKKTAAYDPNQLRGDFKAVLSIIGDLGHSFILVLAVALVWSLDRARPWAGFQLLIAGLLAGGVTAIVKVLTQRPRPFIAAGVEPNLAFEKMLSSSEMESFPSGHTSTAFAVAVSLSQLYPQGRYLFFSLACLVGFQRVITQAHYPSDVLAGAVVGSLAAWIAATLFNRNRLRSGSMMAKATES